MELIIYEANDLEEFIAKVKEAWKKYRNTIKKIAIKVLAKIIQIYIVINSEKSSKTLQYISKMLPVGAVIIADIGMKSFPYATILLAGACYVAKQIKNGLNEDNYNEALLRAKKIVGDVEV